MRRCAFAGLRGGGDGLSMAERDCQARIEIAAAAAFVVLIGFLSPAVARSPKEIINSQEVQSMLSADLEDHIAESRYVNCLATEIERAPKPETNFDALVSDMRGRCPAEGQAYLAAHERERAAYDAPQEGDVLTSLVGEAAFFARTHSRYPTEVELRTQNAKITRQMLIEMAYGQCLHRAALKADDHVSDPTVMASRIVDLCPEEAKSEFKARSEGEMPEVVARLREEYSYPGRLNSARRAVELMRENPHYDD